MKGYLRLMVVLLAAFAGLSNAQAPKTKMTIGTGVDPIFAAFYIAKAGGIFEKNGLDVQLNTGPSGSGMIAFLVKNQSQAAFGGEQAGMQAFNLDSNVVVAAQAATADRWWGIVAKNIPNLEGLKGKKIGVTLGSGSEVFWLAAVEKLKLNAKDYTVVNVEGPEMVAALERGNIDAIVAWEPWITRALAAIPNTKIVQNNQGIILPRLYLYLNKEWAEKNPVAADAFMRSLLEATAMARNDRARAARYVAEYLKLEVPMTEGLMDKLTYDIKIDPNSVDYLKTIEGQLKASGKLARPIDWNGFVYADVLKRVAPDKVTYTPSK